MPGLPNKIIIDDPVIRGGHRAVEGLLDGLAHVGEQIEKHVPLTEAEGLREKYDEGCRAYYDAREAFSDICMEVIREGEKLINKHVIPTAGTKTKKGG